MKNSTIKMLIDFEFTGLFREKEEVVQIKALDVNNRIVCGKNFDSTVPYSAGAVAVLGTYKLENDGKLFSEEEFYNFFSDNFGFNKETILNNIEFYGFSTEQDKKFLRSLYINIHINDIQKELRKITKYEKRMAEEGNCLEACYYLATNKIISDCSHSDLSELRAIQVLYKEAYNTKIEKNNILTYIPYGVDRGSLIENMEHRRLMGIRMNSNDQQYAISCFYYQLKEEIDVSWEYSTIDELDENLLKEKEGKKYFSKDKFFVGICDVGDKFFGETEEEVINQVIIDLAVDNYDLCLEETINFIDSEYCFLAIEKKE